MKFPSITFEKGMAGNVVADMSEYGSWIVSPDPDKDGNRKWEAIESTGADPDTVPEPIWQLLWASLDIYEQRREVNMHQVNIETGTDWQMVNDTRKELERVWRDLLFDREYSNPEEAKVAGIIAEAFHNAEESLFQAANAAQSYGEDPGAAQALQAIASSLTTTKVAQEETVRQEQSA